MGSIEELTRKDQPSVALENFALVADEMIVWNDNERVLTNIRHQDILNRLKVRPRTFWYQVIKSGPFLGTRGILV